MILHCDLGENHQLKIMVAATQPQKAPQFCDVLKSYQLRREAGRSGEVFEGPRTRLRRRSRTGAVGGEGELAGGEQGGEDDLGFVECKRRPMQRRTPPPKGMNSKAEKLRAREAVGDEGVGVGIQVFALVQTQRADADQGAGGSS